MDSLRSVEQRPLGWRLMVLEAHAEPCIVCGTESRRRMLCYLREVVVEEDGHHWKRRLSVHANCWATFLAKLGSWDFSARPRR